MGKLTIVELHNMQNNPFMNYADHKFTPYSAKMSVTVYYLFADGISSLL